MHGCFWHLHPDPKCRDARLPKSNESYWGPKLKRNTERDEQHVAELRKQGWRVLVIWECETKDRYGLDQKLCAFLGRSRLVG